MCVVNKKFELLEFVFDSVYVDLQCAEISLTFTAGSVCLCCVCSHVIVFGLSVGLSWYSMWMRGLPWLWYVYCCLCCVCVCMLGECDGDGNAGVGDGRGVVMVSSGHMGNIRGSGIVSSAADVLWMCVVRGMRGVGRVSEMCRIVFYQSCGDIGSVKCMSVFGLQWCGWCRWGGDRGLD